MNRTWAIVDALNEAPHTDILRPGQAYALRRADQIGNRCGQTYQWKRTGG